MEDHKTFPMTAKTNKIDFQTFEKSMNKKGLVWFVLMPKVVLTSNHPYHSLVCLSGYCIIHWYVTLTFYVMLLSLFSSQLNHPFPINKTVPSISTAADRIIIRQQ